MDPVNVAIFGAVVVVAAAGVWLALQGQARSAVNAHLVLQGSSATLGGEVPVQVALRPRRDVQVDRVVARTRCLRRSVEGAARDHWENPGLSFLFTSRGNRRTWIEHDEVARAEVELAGPRGYRAGEAEMLSAAVPVADGLPTDTSGPLTIQWVLEVQFEIPNSPDVILKRPLQVARRW